MINKHHNLSFNLHDDITRGFLRRKAKYNGPQLFYISTLLFINHKDYSLISSMPHKKSKYLLPHNHNSYRKKKIMSTKLCAPHVTKLLLYSLHPPIISIYHYNLLNYSYTYFFLLLFTSKKTSQKKVKKNI